MQFFADLQCVIEHFLISLPNMFKQISLKITIFAQILVNHLPIEPLFSAFASRAYPDQVAVVRAA